MIHYIYLYIYIHIHTYSARAFPHSAASKKSRPPVLSAAWTLAAGAFVGVIEEQRATWRGATANLRTQILDFGGFDSSLTLLIRGGILMSIGNLLECLSQAISVGILLVGRLGVSRGTGPREGGATHGKSEDADGRTRRGAAGVHGFHLELCRGPDGCVSGQAGSAPWCG